MTDAAKAVEAGICETCGGLIYSTHGVWRHVGEDKRINHEAILVAASRLTAVEEPAKCQYIPKTINNPNNEKCNMPEQHMVHDNHISGLIDYHKFQDDAPGDEVEEPSKVTGLGGEKLVSHFSRNSQGCVSYWTTKIAAPGDVREGAEPAPTKGPSAPLGALTEQENSILAELAYGNPVMEWLSDAAREALKLRNNSTPANAPTKPEKLVPWGEIRDEMSADDLHYLEQAKGFLANSERMDNAPLAYMVAAAFKVSAQLRAALQQVAELSKDNTELKEMFELYKSLITRCLCAGIKFEGDDEPLINERAEKAESDLSRLRGEVEKVLASGFRHGDYDNAERDGWNDAIQWIRGELKEREK